MACTAVGGIGEGFGALNAYRASKGAGSLAESKALSSVALKYACDMLKRGYFSHTTPEGQGFQARLRAGGLPGGCGAENIAYAGSSAGFATALAQWKSSQGHNRNVLGKRYTVAGMAGAKGSGKTYFVLILGQCS